MSPREAQPSLTMKTLRTNCSVFFLQRSFEFAIFETLFFPGSVAAELMETFKSTEITNFSFDPGR